PARPPRRRPSHAPSRPAGLARAGRDGQTVLCQRAHRVLALAVCLFQKKSRARNIADFMRWLVGSFVGGFCRKFLIDAPQSKTIFAPEGKVRGSTGAHGLAFSGVPGYSRPASLNSGNPLNSLVSIF